ncbi:hypothetical protein [Streptomyces albus]|uniref:hypothetical protein n=1 Tax=Streptomyces sp. NRRL F-5639 TaxID=1463867 RepID=UPI00131D69ED|nr:hypothetical protein [Streptomyces sp. NRRL F-5639]
MPFQVRHHARSGAAEKLPQGGFGTGSLQQHRAGPLPFGGDLAGERRVGAAEFRLVPGECAQFPGEGGRETGDAIGDGNTAEKAGTPCATAGTAPGRPREDLGDAPPRTTATTRTGTPTLPRATAFTRTGTPTPTHAMHGARHHGTAAAPARTTGRTLVRTITGRARLRATGCAHAHVKGACPHTTGRTHAHVKGACPHTTGRTHAHARGRTCLRATGRAPVATTMDRAPVRTTRRARARSTCRAPFRTTGRAPLHGGDSAPGHR